MDRTLFEPEHDALRASFRSWLAKEVVPHKDDWEAAGIVPRSVFSEAGRHGFLGMAIPEDFGGGGVDDFRYNLVIGEELQAAGAGAAGLGLTLHNDICLPYYLRYCTEEQRRRWLPGIASGELITAIAMTEPGIGSDLGSMSSTARRDGDHYIVNGSKTFITNGINSDLVIVAVKTDPAQRHRGISLLVLDRGMEGFERGRNLEKIGQSFIDRCVTGLNAGTLTAEEAAMAKWWCTELQKKTVDRCLQLFGGYGYMLEYPIARAYLDARITTIYGGTTEIMKEIVGRSLGL